MLNKFLFNSRSFFIRPIQIYTDGSNKGRVGSWAFIILKSGRLLLEKSGKVSKTGSTQMEIRAATEALKQTPKNAVVDLYSDSKILIDAMKFGVIPEVYSAELSELMLTTHSKIIRWHWIKGHSKNAYNQRCDFLCTQARLSKQT